MSICCLFPGRIVPIPCSQKPICHIVYLFGCWLNVMKKTKNYTGRNTPEGTNNFRQFARSFHRLEMSSTWFWLVSRFKQINTSGSHIANRILTTHIQPSFHATWIFDGQDTTVAAAPHHSRKSGQVIQGKMIWWYSAAIPDSCTTWFWFFGALFGVLLWYHFTTHAHPLRWQGWITEMGC